MSDTEPLNDPALPEATPEPITAKTVRPEVASVTPPAPELVRADRPRRSFWPLLGLIGFLLLAAGEAYLWKLYKSRPDDSAELAALQSQVTALQQQPAPAPAAPAPVASAPPPAAPDVGLGQKLAAVAAQVDAMQTQFAADHGVLTTLQANAVDLGKLTADIGAVETEATADHAALLTLQSSLAALNKLTGQVSTLGQIDAARMALDAGRPLGTIANAPPALARFADAAPPTEASLRLGYPAAARAAARASSAGVDKHRYWASVVARLEGLITISNGAHVIVGGTPGPSPGSASVASGRHPGAGRGAAGCR